MTDIIIRTKHRWLVGGCVELADGSPSGLSLSKDPGMLTPHLPPSCWERTPEGIALARPPAPVEWSEDCCHRRALSVSPFRVQVIDEPLDGPSRLVMELTAGEIIPGDLIEVLERRA